MEKPAQAAGAEIKNAGAFLEELPLLREKQREARQVYLLVVSFYLRKICIDG